MLARIVRAHKRLRAEAAKVEWRVAFRGALDLISVPVAQDTNLMEMLGRCL